VTGCIGELSIDKCFDDGPHISDTGLRSHRHCKDPTERAHDDLLMPFVSPPWEGRENTGGSIEKVESRTVAQ
jgi:hypothetical protein